MRRLPILTGFAAVLLLPGCFGLLMQRPHHKHSFVGPEVWQSAAEANQGKISTAWVKTFKDRELEKLVKLAMENNLDLQESAARLKSAKQGAIIGRAGRFPSIGFAGTGSRTQRK